jgi:hypothetical protein
MTIARLQHLSRFVPRAHPAVYSWMGTCKSDVGLGSLHGSESVVVERWGRGFGDTIANWRWRRKHLSVPRYIFSHRRVTKQEDAK